MAFDSNQWLRGKRYWGFGCRVILNSLCGLWPQQTAAAAATSTATAAVVDTPAVATATAITVGLTLNNH